MALISSTLQAWFADAGLSVLITGMLTLVSIPYTYRFFWGPVLDRYSLCSLGKRRSWILVMQLGLLLGFNGMAWLSPNQSPVLMAFLALALAFCSATQDAAIDAHRVEYLPEKYHGIGATLAVLGYRLALLVSGGLALIMAAKLGWAFTYRFMGLLMITGIFATLWSPEPSKPLVTEERFFPVFVASFRELTSRPLFLPLIGFILFYKLGEAFTTSTSGIVMPFLIQGLGFSLETIGYVNKIMGLGSIILGGLFAGLILIRYSLYRSLMAFGLFQAFTNFIFIILAGSAKSTLMLCIAVVCDNFAAGMGSTALVALLMHIARQPYTATQFSLLVAISTIPRILSGPIGAGLQSALGWVGVYIVAFILSFVFIPFLVRIKNEM